MVKVKLNYENEIKDRGRIFCVGLRTSISSRVFLQIITFSGGGIVAVRIVVRGSATSERSSTIT